MPVSKVQGGYRWGQSGKVYPTKAQAERQGRAAYASGYKGYQDGGIVDVTQGDDPSTVDRVRNFMGETPRYSSGIARVAAQMEQPEKPPLTAAQTAYLAAQLDPTVMTGLADVTGGYPSFPGPDVTLEEAFSGEPMPSFAENVREGNLGIAALQTLGLIPGIGMVTRGRRVVKAASDVAAASDAARVSRHVSRSDRTGRDWQDIPLSYRNERLPFRFLEHHGFEELEPLTPIAKGSRLTDEQYARMVDTYEVLDDGRIRAYSGYLDKHGHPGISQKTFNNPTLGQLRNWMGY